MPPTSLRTNQRPINNGTELKSTPVCLFVPLSVHLHAWLSTHLHRLGEKKTFKKPTTSFTHVANTTQKKWKQNYSLNTRNEF